MDGSLLGVLSVDLPLDRRRPGLVQRELLELFAVQASTAIAHARLRTCQLPITFLKVDRSFARDLPSDKTAAAVVGAVTGLANELGLWPASWRASNAWSSCAALSREHRSGQPAAGQGYLLGPPAGAEEIERVLAEVIPAQRSA